jgi:hypothetical protein
VTPGDTVDEACRVEERRPIGHLANDDGTKGLMASAFGEDVVARKVQVGTTGLGTEVVEALQQ